MKQQLVIQLPTAALDEASSIAWHVFDADDVLQSGGRTELAQLRTTLADVFAGGTTLVLVPGELILLTAVRIPSRQMRQIKQALPYAVEELIADNIEEVHLALPDVPPDEDAELPVAVLRHDLLIHWLDQLYQHGVDPDLVCPDTLAVPWREHGCTLFVDGERVLYRNGRFSAQVFFRSQAAAYLDLLRPQFSGGELGAIPTHSVSSGVDGGDDARELATLLHERWQVVVDSREYTETGAEVLAAGALRERDGLINMLQGGYRVQRRGDGSGWRRGALAASVGLLLYAIVAGGSGLWFSWRAQQLEAQTFNIYRELFPQERRVVSPKKQMQAHLNGGGGGATSSALPLLAKTALGLRNNNVQLDELRYNDQQRDVLLQLRTPTMEALDQIKQQLNGVGLSVEINSAAQRGSETLGRLRLRES